MMKARTALLGRLTLAVTTSKPPSLTSNTNVSLGIRTFKVKVLLNDDVGGFSIDGSLLQIQNALKYYNKRVFFQLYLTLRIWHHINSQKVFGCEWITIKGRSSYPLNMSLLVREDLSSIPGSVKSDTILPTYRHRCDVSSELCCPGATLQRWAPHLLHVSAYYRQYKDLVGIFFW